MGAAHANRHFTAYWQSRIAAGQRTDAKLNITGMQPDRMKIEWGSLQAVVWMMAEWCDRSYTQACITLRHEEETPNRIEVFFEDGRVRVYNDSVLVTETEKYDAAATVLRALRDGYTFEVVEVQ